MFDKAGTPTGTLLFILSSILTYPNPFHLFHTVRFCVFGKNFIKESTFWILFLLILSSRWKCASNRLSKEIEV